MHNNSIVQHPETARSVLLMLSILFVLPTSEYGATTTNEFDPLGRFSNIIYADGASQQFTHDPAGNRTLRVSTSPLTISSIANQTGISGTPTAAIPFMVNNPNISPANLTVWK